ncbi:MAG: ParM/StbA family protein [Peptostreptococcaceae bacterium]|jgi:plasmid segregation protein ParM|nr:ParM/StbA family protein [Peptostreptococcaceae bacterium]
MKKIEMYLSVGNDNGNSEHDLVIDGELICQPNVFAKVKELPNLDEVNPEYVVKNIDSNLIVTINSPSVNPGLYYVGDYARKSRHRTHDIKVGAENSKVDSDVPVVNTLGQIAGYAVQKAYKDNPNLEIEIEVKVDMSTELPVTQYSNENAKKFAEKFMKDNKHQVTVHVGTKRVNVNVLFEFVKVLPESVPLVFRLQKLNKKRLEKIEDEKERENFAKLIEEMFKEFNERYNSVEEKEGDKVKNIVKDDFIDGSYFKKKKILHISVGEGTTEYPKTNDIVFDPEFIEGSNNGVGHAIKEALTPFKKEFKFRTFTRQDYSNQLRDPNEKFHAEAMEYVETHLENEAEDILWYAKDEVEKANNDIDIICVHGGGSILMKDYLADELYNFGKETRIKIFYVPEKFAVTLEAWGMHEFTNSKLFKMLKEKHQASNNIENKDVETQNN